MLFDSLLPARHEQRVMDPLQRAVVVPQVEVVVHRGAGRQILGDRPPLATRAQHVHQAVDHRPKIDAAPAPAPLGRRDQRFNQRPFRIRQVARIAKPAPVVASTVLVRPHQQPPNLSCLESQITHETQYVAG